MKLITGCNEQYISKIQAYLSSLRQFAEFPIYFCTVGFRDKGDKKINAVHLPRSMNAGAPVETESIQHGSFLPIIEAHPAETIIYTDGDFVMQRPMTQNEQEFLTLKDYEVVAGYNFGAHCTLMHDAQIIGRKISNSELLERWGDILLKAQDFNAGFLAMNTKTWQILYTNYMRDWQKACADFAHQARQQWLISYEIATLGFYVKICPWSIHAHGHGGLKPGMERRRDGVYYNGDLALFRHYL